MTMVTMLDIERHNPDREMPPVSRECAPAYWRAVESGERIAYACDVTFILGLCRNSMPAIQLNTQRLERLGSRFWSWQAFVYENDSEDGTAEHLRAWAESCEQATVETVKHDRPQLSAEKSKRRTDALAEYRNRCLEWARDHIPTGANHRIIVIDFDTWGGWSDDGVMNGLHWLEELPGAAGMASVSTVEMAIESHPLGKLRIHYDAWAFRLNHWHEHDMLWFPHWHPPVGSDPIRCNSAFGGMAIYRPDAFFAGGYFGGDCEHVHHHRKIQAATGLSMYLNPSQRLVMNWIPDGGQHSHD